MPDDDLVLLYNLASLFVFPSRYEGFGLPLLEAMACSTPVVAANNSSIPEIVGDAALLTDAEDATAMGELMANVLTDEYLLENLSEKGIRRSEWFTWKDCAIKTLDVYRDVVSARNIF